MINTTRDLATRLILQMGDVDERIKVRVVRRDYKGNVVGARQAAVSYIRTNACDEEAICVEEADLREVNVTHTVEITAPPDILSTHTSHALARRLHDMLWQQQSQLPNGQRIITISDFDLQCLHQIIGALEEVKQCEA